MKKWPNFSARWRRSWRKRGFSAIIRSDSSALVVFVSSDYGDHPKGLVYRSHGAKIETEGAWMLLEAGLDSCQNGNRKTLNVDANGSIPELVNGMLVFSLPGRLDLLPALPASLPKGEVSEILARGQITIDRLAWDMPAHMLRVVLTSGKDQLLSVCLPKAERIKTVRVEGAQLQEPAGPGNICSVTLVKDRKAKLEIGF